MSDIQLNDFSITELRRLSQRIDKEIDKRQAQERKKVLARIKGIAAEAGMTVEEVLESTSKGKARSLPKYQNPNDPSQTWTGRGKRPSWIKEAIKQGKELEELRI